MAQKAQRKKIYKQQKLKKGIPKQTKIAKEKKRNPNKKYKSQIHKKDNANQKSHNANKKATTQTKKPQHKQKSHNANKKATTQTKKPQRKQKATTQRQGGLGSILPFSRHFIRHVLLSVWRKVSWEVYWSITFISGTKTKLLLIFWIINTVLF